MTVTIYALVKDHRLIYFGQTIDLPARLIQHRRLKALRELKEEEPA